MHHHGIIVAALFSIVAIKILPLEVIAFHARPYVLRRTTGNPRTSSPIVPLFLPLFATDNDDDDEEKDLISQDDDGDGDGPSSFVGAQDSFTSEEETARRANEILLGANAHSVDLQKEVEQSFLQYALSIILGRALPDARDGLKPVHRRILYSMSELGLAPQSVHRKCARIVGEVLGKYHPHGDMAVYDSLVRMAQDFSTGTRLIDGQGNFGSIDSDPAAAMRYTECRLTRVASEAMLNNLKEDTVDYVPNFDGTETEPTVLPAKLPFLLLNGCAGIAVGMATNVPPHNLKELVDGCVALLESRKEGAPPLTDKQLFRLIPAPDFPTGANIMGKEGARKLYSTGSGGVVMRATTSVEKVFVGRSRQSRTAIVVTQLPFQVNKAALLEKIAGLVNDKKLDGISDLRDESDREGIRVVIELKRDAVSAVVLNNLYKKTNLQTTFSGNFLALMGSGTVPQRFTLRSALDCFLEFRFDTIRRKTRYQLDKVDARIHIVEGLLMALASVDDLIDIIRSASDQSSARETLMDPASNKQDLGLSKEQADAVLRLQLGQLTRLNKGKLEEEQADLRKSQKELQTLLTVDEAVREDMKTELIALQDKFGIPRRTQILSENGEVSEMDLVRNSRSVIVVTRGGYIKRMPLKTFESQGRGTRGKKGTDGGTDNEVAHCFTCNDHDTLLMVTQRGIAFGLRAYQVPLGTRTAKGQAIPSVLPINVDDTITAILPVSDFSQDEEYIVLATKNGFIKKTRLSAFENISSRGLTIASLEAGDLLLWAHQCRDEDEILIGSKNGMATRFEAEEVRATARTSKGVRAMKLKEGDSIADMNVLDLDGVGEEAPKYALIVTSHGYGKRVLTSDFRTTARGLVGVIAMKFKNDQDEVKCLCPVADDDEIFLITAQGIMVRQKVDDVPSQSRTATGVLVQKVDVPNGDEITSVSIVPTYEEKDELLTSRTEATSTFS